MVDIGRPRLDPLRKVRAVRGGVLVRDESAELERARLDPLPACPRNRGWILLGCKPCARGWAAARGCGRVGCPYCAVPAALGRSRRLYRSMGGVPLGVFVVTLPSGWNEHLSAPLAREIERRVWGVIEDHYGALGVRVGARQYWHPCGDRCASCGKVPKEHGARFSLGEIGQCELCGAAAHPHAHLNFLVPLAGAVQGRAGWTGEVTRLRYQLTREQLAAFSAALASTLGELAKGLGLPDYTPQFFYEFRVEQEKRRHALRYFARPFPAWSAALKAIGTGRRWGLAAARASEEADAWRSRVKGRKGEAKALECPCCAGPVAAFGAFSGPVDRAWAEGGERWLCIQASTLEKGSNQYRAFEAHLRVWK